MSNELLCDYIDLDKVYELSIGKTFQNDAKYSFNQFKCKNL
jgi:hypothetical protein